MRTLPTSGRLQEVIGESMAIGGTPYDDQLVIKAVRLVVEDVQHLIHELIHKLRLAPALSTFTKPYLILSS